MGDVEVAISGGFWVATGGKRGVVEGVDRVGAGCRDRGERLRQVGDTASFDSDQSQAQLVAAGARMAG